VHSSARDDGWDGRYLDRMRQRDGSSTGEARSQVVPHVEVCPACAGPIVGRSCKVYCTNPACELHGRVIENCAGD